MALNEEETATSEESPGRTPTRRALARLADRRKWPRRWWQPVWHALDQELGLEEWKRQNDEASLTIRRTMMASLAFSMFCAVTLLAPDSDLLDNRASIKLPFAQTEASKVSSAKAAERRSKS